MRDSTKPYSNPYSDFASSDAPSVAEGTEFISGESNIATSGASDLVSSVSLDSIISVLSTVFDPEIPVSIYELGLIYEIRRVSASDRDEATSGANTLSNESVDSEGIDWEILMTLTAPACPVAGELPQQVADAAASVEGAGRVRVRLTWSPPWTPDMMSEDARYALGM